MFLAIWFRRLTALVIVLALAAPAWTVCRTVTSAEPMAGMPCCHHPEGTAAGSMSGTCCRVQPDDPAGSPAAPGLAPTVRTASLAIVTDVPVAPVSSHLSHDRRAEADGRHRPKTAPYLLDSVLLI